MCKDVIILARATWEITPKKHQAMNQWNSSVILLHAQNIINVLDFWLETKHKGQIKDFSQWWIRKNKHLVINSRFHYTSFNLAHVIMLKKTIVFQTPHIYEIKHIFVWWKHVMVSILWCQKDMNAQIGGLFRLWQLKFLWIMDDF